MMAPATKARNELMAAAHGPPMALGSRPTSSRIIESSARSGVAKSVPTIERASSAREAALLVDALQDGALAGLVHAQLLHLQLPLGVEELVLRAHRDVLPDRHREGAREESGDAGDDDGLVVRGGARDAHDERQIGDEAVTAAEDGRAQEGGRAAFVRRRRRGRDTCRQPEAGDEGHGIDDDDVVAAWGRGPNGPPRRGRQAGMIRASAR